VAQPSVLRLKANDEVVEHQGRVPRGRYLVDVTWTVFATFVLLEATLCLIPGPAVLLVVSSALGRGLRIGIGAAGGILAGNATYFVLSALGIVSVLLASHQAFIVIKWFGAVYLAYLGLRALLARHVPSVVHAPSRSRVADGHAFASGFVTQISNPKALLFFAALLPQFIDPRQSVPLQVAILGIASTLIELLGLMSYALLAERVRQSRAADRASLWIERAGGAILVAIAVRIAREPLTGAGL